MPLFVEVARQKSFTRAADALDMPLSTVSRRIIALEKDLGIPLFFRSARKVELTENGQAFFERCGFILTEVDAAWEELSRDMKSPTGKVRVSMPTDFYHNYLSGTLGSFAAQWPGIALHVQLSERWVDLHSEPYDLDIRIGKIPDSNLRVRGLFTVQPVLYASPKLLEFYPPPEEPSELSRMPCVSLMQQGEVWTLNKEKRTETIFIRAAHMTNNVSVLLELALAGLGAGWFLPAMTSRYEAAGELVRLLPGWTHFKVTVSIVTATNRIPQRVRLFIDHLVAYFNGLPR